MVFCRLNLNYPHTLTRVTLIAPFAMIRGSPKLGVPYWGVLIKWESYRLGSILGAPYYHKLPLLLCVGWGAVGLPGAA